jgi:fatty acid desaturase
MDHHEQHHVHHRQEREHEKKLHKAHEQELEKKTRFTSIHPAWFLAMGVVLIGLVVLVWTLWWL